jgi:hypothetical protein
MCSQRWRKLTLQTCCHNSKRHSRVRLDCLLQKMTATQLSNRGAAAIVGRRQGLRRSNGAETFSILAAATLQVVEVEQHTKPLAASNSSTLFGCYLPGSFTCWNIPQALHVRPCCTFCESSGTYHAPVDPGLTPMLCLLQLCYFLHPHMNPSHLFSS